MFDDITTNQAPPPGNLPFEPEDILAGVDEPVSPAEVDNAQPPTPPNALSAGMLKKKAVDDTPASDPEPKIPITQSAQTPIAYAVKGPVLGKVLLVFFGGAALVGVSLGAWWGYQRVVGAPTSGVTPVATNSAAKGASQPEPSSNQPIVAPVGTEPAATIQPTTNEGSATNSLSTKLQNDQILFGETVDTDHDGIADKNEPALGTEPLKADTDGDGLSDGEEAIVWKTDPLNPDTDGDGFPDGQEVHNNYNPLGPGKIAAETK